MHGLVFVAIAIFSAQSENAKRSANRGVFLRGKTCIVVSVDKTARNSPAVSGQKISVPGNGETRSTDCVMSIQFDPTVFTTHP
jgi:hypothetical protein